MLTRISVSWWGAVSHRKKGLGPDPWSVDLTGEPGLCRCSEGRMKADWVRVGPWPRDWGPYERKAGGGGLDSETQDHRRKTAVSRWSPRWERCSHQPLDSEGAGHQQGEGEARRLPRSLQRVRGPACRWKASGFQNRERTHVGGFKPPSPWSFVTAALGAKYNLLETNSDLPWVWQPRCLQTLRSVPEQDGRSPPVETHRTKSKSYRRMT